MTGTDAAATAALRARAGALIGYARCSTIAQEYRQEARARVRARNPRLEASRG